MLGVLADDHDLAVSLDDLALFANRLYGSSYFHFFLLRLLIAPCNPASGKIVR